MKSSPNEKEEIKVFGIPEEEENPVEWGLFYCKSTPSMVVSFKAFDFNKTMKNIDMVGKWLGRSYKKAEFKIGLYLHSNENIYLREHHAINFSFDRGKQILNKFDQ